MWESISKLILNLKIWHVILIQIISIVNHFHYRNAFAYTLPDLYALKKTPHKEQFSEFIQRPVGVCIVCVCVCACVCVRVCVYVCVCVCKLGVHLPTWGAGYQMIKKKKKHTQEHNHKDCST